MDPFRHEEKLLLEKIQELKIILQKIIYLNLEKELH